MTLAEAKVMRAIVDHGPMTSREIHVKADVGEASSRTIPAQLVYGGFLERRRDAFALTQQGTRWAQSKRGQRQLDVPLPVRH